MKTQWLLAGLGLGLLACDDTPIVQGSSVPAAVVDAGAVGEDSGLPPTTLVSKDVAESEFVETERTRDPFRSFAARFLEQSNKPLQNERKVTLAEYSVDELKPVAIVLGGDYPRAMLVDPTGKGWVVKRGDYIGRPEVVHLGGANGSDYQLNWRVDRVRDGDIVLVREDPAQPSAAPQTRVIVLHTETDSASN